MNSHALVDRVAHPDHDYLVILGNLKPKQERNSPKKKARQEQVHAKQKHNAPLEARELARVRLNEKHRNTLKWAMHSYRETICRKQGMHHCRFIPHGSDKNYLSTKKQQMYPFIFNSRAICLYIRDHPDYRITYRTLPLS